MSEAFSGQWVTRPGGVRVPVVETTKPKPMCLTCGQVPAIGRCGACKDSDRVRVHGNHAGFNQHARRHEPPCRSCSDAEKTYQGKRYRKGSLSPTDRAWAEKAAVRWSWVFQERANRASLTNS